MDIDFMVTSSESVGIVKKRYIDDAASSNFEAIFMIRMHVVALAVGLAGVFFSQASRAAEPLVLTSSAFLDNAMLAPTYSGKGSPNCAGDNVSPPFAWSGAPAGTKSFAFLMYDPDGRNGLGVSHELVYGIPADVRGFKLGDLAGPQGAMMGCNTRGTGGYLGPCPPPGTGAHHYLFTIIATDLEPDALPKDLTRDQLFEKLNGHAKAAASLVGRFGG